MTKFDSILNRFIRGKRGEWYFSFWLGKELIQGGYFYHKKTARDHLECTLLRFISSRSILEDYLNSIKLR